MLRIGGEHGKVRARRLVPIGPTLLSGEADQVDVVEIERRLHRVACRRRGCRDPPRSATVRPSLEAMAAALLCPGVMTVGPGSAAADIAAPPWPPVVMPEPPPPVVPLELLVPPVPVAPLVAPVPGRRLLLLGCCR